MTNKQNSTDSTRVSNQLPFDIRAALIRASKIKNQLQRTVAIEAVQAMARARFPKLFRTE